MMRFREYESGGGAEFELDAFQEEAVQAIAAGESVLVAAPTGAGKTVVAEYAVEFALKRGERVVYTAPIKALSNQKFRDFRSRFGDQVGIMTGDVTINPTAPALIMTTEIFRNALFAETGRFDDVRFLIFDEVHYINDLERGTVWEESIIFAPHGTQFVCLSATMPNVDELAAWISEVRGTQVRVVREEQRPVPLQSHVYCGDRVVPLDRLEKCMRPRPQLKFKRHDDRASRNRTTRAQRTAESNDSVIDVLEERDQLPCIFFCFSRAACETNAWRSLERNLLTEIEREQVTDLYRGLCVQYDMTGERLAHEFEQLVTRGVAFHHAGMLPTIKEIIERLFSSGLIKLLFTTETFAVGVNMPARTVVFESLRKFDGVTFGYMESREFHQMSGRAGRRGMDEAGQVYSIVDPGEDDERGIKRVLTGNIEPIQSRFELAYSTILNLYSRVGEAIYEACSNSFAMFQRRHHHKPNVSPVHEQKIAKKKLAVLHDLDYIGTQGLKRKGKLAAKINGYEMMFAEMYAAGLFDELDADELNVLLTAIVYEPRRRSLPRRLARKVLQPIAEPAFDCWRGIASIEKIYRLDELTKGPEFGLSLATFHWSQGIEFDELERLTDLGPGDVVRNFRLAIQLNRQIMKAIEGDVRNVAKLQEAISRLNRDIVDAERQLRVE